MTDIQNWPHWLLGALVIAVLIVGCKLNTTYFDWLHRRSPWAFRPIVLLAILAICVAVIVVGMWINPPSTVQADFQRAHPELFSKPVSFPGPP